MPRKRSPYRPTPMPRNAELVRRYLALAVELCRFAGSLMKLLILAGPRGSGKTEAVKAVLKSLSLDAHYLSCPGRPWRLYQDLYRHANHAVAEQR